jgi:hypothetical protein
MPERETGGGIQGNLQVESETSKLTLALHDDFIWVDGKAFSCRRNGATADGAV